VERLATLTDLNHKQLTSGRTASTVARRARVEGEKMKKQMLKGFTMLIAIITMAFVTAVVSANAQTSRQKLTANVPFNFSVGDKEMNAGDIRVGNITEASDSGIVVRNADDNQNAIRLTNTLQSAKAQEQTRLVFHRYGDKYYLAQIWTAGSRTGRELVKSKSERALEREMAASQDLASTTKQETVTIVASLQ
jgi:hypothetical protein